MIFPPLLKVKNAVATMTVSSPAFSDRLGRLQATRALSALRRSQGWGCWWWAAGGLSDPFSVSKSSIKLIEIRQLSFPGDSSPYPVLFLLGCH